jgi:hypothetical protein
MSDASYYVQPEISENAMLKRQLAEAERKLRAIDVAEATAKAAKRAADEAAAQAAAKAASDKALSEQLEGHRRSAWVNFKVDDALAKGNDAFLSNTEKLNAVPADSSWPPGTAASDYSHLVTGIPEPAPAEVEKFDDSILGEAIARALPLAKID